MIDIHRLAWLAVLVLVLGCGERERTPEEAPPAADTIPGGPTASVRGEAMR